MADTTSASKQENATTQKREDGEVTTSPPTHSITNPESTRPAWRSRRHSPCIGLGALIVVTAVPEAIAAQWTSVAVLVATLAGVAVPTIAEKITDTHIPVLLQSLYAGLLFAGPYGGSALHFYAIRPGWDSVVHFYSGILIGFCAIFVIGQLKHRYAVTLPTWFEVSVTIAAGTMAAALWEIAEFTSDHTIGTVAQNGNTDTMTDIICGTIGCLLIAMTLLAHRKRGWFTHLAALLDPHD